MENQELLSFIGIMIVLVITTLYFIFGRLLQSAGKELGNTSLSKAGNIIIFILVLTLFTSAIYYLSIDKFSREANRTYKPTKREKIDAIKAQEQIDNAVIPNSSMPSSKTID